MSPSWQATALVAALAGSANAHGYLKTIWSNGKWYEGTNPDWAEDGKEDTPGWYADDPDHEFLLPEDIGTSDLSCHKSAVPASASVPVTAGDTISLQFSDWAENHKGGLTTHIACIDTDFTDATAESLRFFKIAHAGYEDGEWAAMVMREQSDIWNVTIPKFVNGNCVLRHEIIAIHNAKEPNGAQFYPQCVNLKITGGTNNIPAGVAGGKLYSTDEPGLVIDIDEPYDSWTIPGMAVVTEGASSTHDTSEWGDGSITYTTNDTSTSPDTYSSSSSASAAEAYSTSADSDSTSAADYSATSTAEAEPYSTSAAASSSVAAEEYSSASAASSSSAASAYSTASATASSTASASDYSSAVSAADYSSASAAALSAYSSASSASAASASATVAGCASAGGMTLPSGYTDEDVISYAVYLMQKGAAQKNMRKRSFQA